MNTSLEEIAKRILTKADPASPAIIAQGFKEMEPVPHGAYDKPAAVEAALNEAINAVTDGECTQDHAYTLLGQCRKDSAQIAALRAELAAAKGDNPSISAQWIVRLEERTKAAENEAKCLREGRDKRKADLAAANARAEALNLESIDRGQEAYDAQEERDTARASLTQAVGLLTKCRKHMVTQYTEPFHPDEPEIKDIDAFLTAQSRK